MNVVLCEYAEKRKFTAGNKARTDTVRILKEIGYEHIPLFYSKSGRLKIIFQMIRAMIGTFFTAGRGDIVLIQYPYHPLIVNQVLVKLLSLERLIKKFKIYILIHDVEGLRVNSGTGNGLKEEAMLLNNADRIICHNKKMLQALSNADGESEKYSILGVFDYLYTGSGAKNVGCTDGIYTIIVAGNLKREKSGYLYSLPKLENVRFNLYGIDYEGESNERIVYKGKYPPDELIDHLEGSFGLVWDGDSADTCAGIYGQYLRYNNPHKFSLYLAAGLPVIVWKESALADYVRSYDIGICIDSLEMLGSELEKVTKERYSRIVNNVLTIRNDIIQGKHLIGAIERLTQ